MHFCQQGRRLRSCERAPSCRRRRSLVYTTGTRRAGAKHSLLILRSSSRQVARPRGPSCTRPRVSVQSVPPPPGPRERRRTLTVAPHHHRRRRAEDRGVGHHVPDRARVVPHVGRLHFGDVQVACPLGDETSGVLLQKAPLTVENPRIFDFW